MGLEDGGRGQKSRNTGCLEDEIVRKMVFPLEPLGTQHTDMFRSMSLISDFQTLVLYDNEFVNWQ